MNNLHYLNVEVSTAMKATTYLSIIPVIIIIIFPNSDYYMLVYENKVPTPTTLLEQMLKYLDCLHYSI